jgi:AcrR family transcriptional regulator
MSQTKLRILESAMQLFNEQGVAEVRLQQIADGAGMSTGNLAYHFNNKESIVSAAFQQVHQELAEVLRLYSVYPNLLDFEIQLSQFYKVTEDYPFFFTDLLAIERLCETAKIQYQQFFTRLTQQFEKRIALNRLRGLFRAEETARYHEVAVAMTMTCVHWRHHQHLTTNASANVAKFKNAIWLHLFPYFTELGQAEFNLLLGSAQPGLERNF